MGRRVAAPTLVIHGDDDRDQPARAGRGAGARTGGDLVVWRAPATCPLVRDPVRVNLPLRDFVRARSRRRPPRRRGAGPGPATRRTGAVRLVAHRPGPRPPRHRHRRRAPAPPSRPGDRLAGPAPGDAHARPTPASACIPPAPAWPASRPTWSPRAASTACTASRPGGGWTRSCWPTSWSSTTWSPSSDYDLVVGDEAWDVDYYLHENPELKRFAYCWLTDFVGWLPMPEGGEREARLTADYNAEMIGAHRPPPAGPRPGAVRRQPARHRARHASARTCRASATGPRRTPLPRLRHRLRPEGGRRPGARCAPSSATRPTSGCAW